jgi:hypothetical protein
VNTNKALACGDKPHSAAATIKLPEIMARKFEQQLREMVAQLGDDIAPAKFGTFVTQLHALMCGIGREVLTETLEALDRAQPTIKVGDQVLRYRGKAESGWLTPLGKITVGRRTYRDDKGASTVPLDDACGMRDRYMTPDIEEMVAFGMAMLTASETEQLLGKTLPEGPSATAIQSVVNRIGAQVGSMRTQVEAAIDAKAPLSIDGDTLVISWDGVMVPMREDAAAAWREASVAAVSIYKRSSDGPTKIDTRYLARMPEIGMQTLLDRVSELVAKTKSERKFQRFALICDGKDTIWRAAAGIPALADAVWILDFYHASENLMKAIVAAHGDGAAATRWHEKLTKKLLKEDRAAENIVRTLRRWRSSPGITSGARKIIRNALKYFLFHRDRLRYSTFAAMGLPIGSGPVESAAKVVVQARLKRSGMRWTREGGQHVLDLRAHLKSGRWEAMWQALSAAA